MSVAAAPGACNDYCASCLRVGKEARCRKLTKGLRICLFALQYAVVAAGASVLGLPDDFPPMGGIREAAPAMDPRLLKTTSVNLSEHMERPLEYHRCAAASTTSSSSKTVLPSIQRYLFCGHEGTMEETTKGLRICLFALQVGCFSKLPSGSVRLDDPFLVVLPCPEAVRECALHLRRLLLLGGDIKTNPGPMTKTQEEKFNSVFDSMQRIEANNVSLLESVNQVLLLHATLIKDFECLTQRVGSKGRRKRQSSEEEAWNRRNSDVCIER
ncbi:hypothetical protein HPB51_025194 [Rhipicephalus microplus]|uniref:Uncharacterized protein n=1 Tax=Rhipicephalus microplus TaxID=6941 RepID=A0A9J6DY45_RHIMP|nr:hypothetical protein HPB51_025194 [Rhipicephalus microplus]